MALLHLSSDARFFCSAFWALVSSFVFRPKSFPFSLIFARHSFIACSALLHSLAVTIKGLPFLGSGRFSSRKLIEVHVALAISLRCGPVIVPVFMYS